MATLNGALDIAKTALLTAQKSINVASHNIANANTEGYTRQRAVVEPTDPVSYGGLFFGTGVSVNNVVRVYDGFQVAQLRDARSSLARYETSGSLVKSLEAAMNDLSGAGILTRLDAFFNTFQDVANSPSSYAERSKLLSNAETLSDVFNNTDGAIRQNITNINNELGSIASTINGLSERVAELNKQISTIEVGGASANDLKDKRDVLLDELGQLIDIKTVENDDGVVDVYAAGGFFLVSGVRTSPLEVNVNPDRPDGTYNILSSGTVINSRISGGKVKGLLEGSQRYLDTQERLNTLAASLIKGVNAQHRAGYGLDSSTGVDFFTPHTVWSKPQSSNTGGAVISNGTVTDLNLLTLNTYEIRFSSSTNYDVFNTATKQAVASGVYSSGGAIAFDGLSVVITDNTGAPAGGDIFTVDPVKNAAQYIGVAVTDAKKIAASSSAAALPGDNSNALLLSGLKDASSVNGMTYSEYYRSIVVDIGTAANSASINYDAHKKITEELKNVRDSLSGVSIEEEAINLIKLQRAFEAAAKVMSTVDKMYDTLLSMR